MPGERLQTTLIVGAGLIRKPATADPLQLWSLAHRIEESCPFCGPLFAPAAVRLRSPDQRTAANSSE
jgi:hypothetical protein